ncbi:hypothetical protein HUT18_15685 [Streptomyces sp. NA04227]|uniref:hypothetical protein n=1 Tax=Streptomyces sp. NA04227 TaxID=2742136 RepID=UPI0015902476|nr:hypothetical protein [Streptomyces sp. NA04227]QKW07604.1 hypothetical protein HUT18_15685 [Streptomyces sp. NA04227]
MPNVAIGEIRVTSQPQPGQSKRSSANFSLKDRELQFPAVVWQVEPENEHLRFDVFEDKTADVDPVVFEGVQPGHQTHLTRYHALEDLYIGKVSGATTDAFTVTIYGVPATGSGSSTAESR